MKEIRDWLEPPDLSANFDQAREVRYAKTNTWFLKHRAYRSWRAGKSDYIWLYGPSGCGKTVLSSTVIEELLRKDQCLYFFFDFRDEKKQTLRNLLLSLIYQLYSANNGPKEPLDALFSSRHWNKTKPSTDDLIRVFDNSVRQAGMVELILDALDESKKGKDREELLQWLCKRMHPARPKYCPLRIMLTSRSDQQDIIDRFDTTVPERTKVCIEREARMVRDDIRKYIQKRIGRDRMFAKWRNRERNSESEVGLDSREESGSEDKFYPDCDTGFGEELDDDDKCLQLAHSSVRDFLLSETPKPSLNVHFAVISCKPTLVQLLLAYLRSILVTSPVELTSSMELCASYASYEWVSQTKVKEVEEAAYDDILKFLLFNSSRPFSKSSHPEFRFYKGPPFYVACKLGLVSTVERLLAEGINPNERKKKARLVEAEAPADSYYKRKLIEFHLEEREPIADHDDSKNALHVACKKGHERVVRLLLDYGAEVNARSEDVYAGRTPLYYTCDSNGNEAQRVIIARMLIDSGADVKISKGELGTALHGACRNGNLDLATLLIENGANVNAQAEVYEYCLTIACDLGINDIADTLIKNGADVNAEGGLYHTALQAAAASDSRSVKLLLDNGANLNVQGGFYGTALIAACENSNRKGVKMLLEHGADPNLQDKRSKTALIGAIRNAYKGKNIFEIVRMLLEKGANVDCPDGEFGSALGAAISRPLWDVVQLLVEKGADLNLLRKWQKNKLLKVDREQFSAFVIERLEGLEISERLRKRLTRARKHRNRMK